MLEFVAAEYSNVGSQFLSDDRVDDDREIQLHVLFVDLFWYAQLFVVQCERTCIFRYDLDSGIEKLAGMVSFFPYQCTANGNQR